MEKKKMPLPKKKPRHASPKHPMNTEKTKPLGQAGGGKLKMVEKDGKKVPFFAADGVGKMMGGGMMKKKMMGGGMMKKNMSYSKGGPVKVKSGDTLSQIAKSKGVTLKALMAANPSIRNANQIRVGQSIKIPTGGKSSNPFKGMKRSSMKALADDTAANRARLRGAKPSKARTAKSPDVAKKRATTTTRLNQLGEVNRRRRAADASAKARRPDTDRRPTPVSPNKTSSLKGVSSAENKRLADIRKKARGRADRRMGGGSMKKVQGYKSGGLTVRGAGAATKGTGFNRAG
ncbi:MAG: hypothetical protein CL857_02730 [Cryomorphaceae bacterium]|nr:hypothetical protein [Cryomorphaceae bacterium]|tara:strand:- start:5105 stop:5971 length:867 start_codon:yes stop_codon:yes gene_type:complete